MSHSKFNPTNDRHAETGHDRARIERGISVFRVRSDREWDPMKVARAEHVISLWLLRLFVRQGGGIPDLTVLKTSLVGEKGAAPGRYEHLVAQYDITVGWSKPFVCYAAAFSLPDEPEVPPFIEALKGMMAEARAARERRNGAPLN